ncbi:MAG: hypothetical protein JNL58_04500 [Planctomyces sp.]|nr:hypothetical protein [Planctomyces sp.]
MTLWTPAELGSSIIFGQWDASTLSGADNSNVSSWADSSDNGRTLSTGATPPKLRTSVGEKQNGLNTVQISTSIFDSRQFWYKAGSEVTCNGMFAISVYKCVTGVTNARVVDVSGRVQHTAQTVGFSQGLVSFSNAATGWTFTLTFRQGITHTQTVIIGQDMLHSGSPPYEVQATPYNESADFQLVGSVAEVLILRTIPFADIRRRIEGYIAHKWGITSVLASDHPYKITAPTIDEPPAASERVLHPIQLSL